MTETKTRNEGRRLFAGFLNALAIGAVGAAALAPEADLSILPRVGYLLLGGHLHLGAQIVLRRLESET